MKKHIFSLRNFFSSLLILLLAFQAQARNTELVIKAKGSKAHGVYAHFQVYVNGLQCGSKHVSMDFEEYCFSVPFDTDEIKEVRIVFDNDVYSMGEDRNLCIRSIYINDEIPIKASQKTAKYVCQNGNAHPYCGMMLWNGTLTFNVEDLKIHPGDILLTSQEEVNLFAHQYVEGNLTISGEDITDLSPLSMLASVKKALIIERNPKLVDIRGLNALIEVGFISIEQNPSLRNINGFDQLEKCGGMYIRSNDALNTIKCFEESPDI